jgi:serine protease Do
VMPDQAAGKAGMQPGDVIILYENQRLSTISPMRQLRQWILETDVGKLVSVDVLRNGRRRTLSLRIGKRPLELP